MNTELAKMIGDGVRAARKSVAKRTQLDVSESLGLSVEFYSRIERGTALPSMDTFAKIVTTLGVSADLLLGSDRGLVVAAAVPARDPDSPEVRRALRLLRQSTTRTVVAIMTLLREIARGRDDIA